MEMVYFEKIFFTGFLGFVEFILFILFISPLLKQNFFSVLKLCFCIIGLSGIILLHFQYYSFPVHCTLFIVILVFLIVSLTKTNMKNSFFLSVVFTLAMEISHLFADDILVSWIFKGIFPTGAGARESVTNILFYSFILFIITMMLRNFVYRNDRSKLRIEEMLPPFTAVIPFVYMRTIQYNLYPEGADIDNSIYIILILLACTSLFLIISNEIFLMHHIHKNELNQMEMLLNMQKQQYLAKKESIDGINQKYHDLKHILVGLEALENSYDLKEVIEQLREVIVPYESVQETGNEVINILLTEKMKLCSERNVRVIAYINASECSFIHPLDLSVLFGNAMDNAIEAASQMKEKEQREIYIRVHRNKNMIVFRFENYYHHINKNYETTKLDKENHGFGLKAIEKITEKYNGLFDVDVTDTQFCLNLILPIPDLKHKIEA